MSQAPQGYYWNIGKGNLFGKLNRLPGGSQPAFIQKFKDQYKDSQDSDSVILD